MIRVGILGAKGYTSGELLRLLRHHPEARVACLQARVEKPEPLANYFPSLRGAVNLTDDLAGPDGKNEAMIEPIDLPALGKRCDVVFLALPHTAAQAQMPELLAQGPRVIDLSADFRFDSIDLFESTYAVKHLAPELNATIPYALPELFRSELKNAKALANPGCYTTASILALAPLVRRSSVVDIDHIVINALSGVTGAGRTPGDSTHFPAVNESVTAYKVGCHRHRPEIEEKLSRIADQPIKVTFTPHLMPINRGILATITVPARREIKADEVRGWLTEAYGNEPFIRILPAGEVPATAAVMMTNYVDLAAFVDANTQSIIIIAAIDNLTKGASGQAIQGMNILFGLPETTGLI